MMKNTILALLLFLICSCSTNGKPRFIYRNDIKSQKKAGQLFFSKNFRDEVFYRCLRHGYGDKLDVEIEKLMSEKDLFSINDEPSTKNDSIQDSLARKIIKDLPPPYVHIEDENDLKNKNFIISTCLSYYESRELDSISKRLYKEKVKEDKKL